MSNSWLWTLVFIFKVPASPLFLDILQVQITYHWKFRYPLFTFPFISISCNPSKSTGITVYRAFLHVVYLILTDKCALKVKATPSLDNMVNASSVKWFICAILLPVYTNLMLNFHWFPLKDCSYFLFSPVSSHLIILTSCLSYFYVLKRLQTIRILNLCIYDITIT